MKTLEEQRNDVAQILRDNITFSPQTNDYVIHGAIDKLFKYFRSQHVEQEQEIERLRKENVKVGALLDIASEDARIANSRLRTLEEHLAKLLDGLGKEHTSGEPVKRSPVVSSRINKAKKALESTPTEQPELLDKLKEKSKQLDHEAKSHRVTNSEQLKVNAGTEQPEAQKNCQHEQHYPNTVRFSFKDPDFVIHLKTNRCAMEHPHHISECCEFVKTFVEGYEFRKSEEPQNQPQPEIVKFDDIKTMDELKQSTKHALSNRKKRWSVSRWGSDEVLMYDGAIKAITNQELCDLLNTTAPVERAQQEQSELWREFDSHCILWAEQEIDIELANKMFTITRKQHE